MGYIAGFRFDGGSHPLRRGRLRTCADAPDAHAAAALPFLEAGIPTLIEKPLAADRAECETLQAAASKSKIVLGVNQNFVHHPAFVRLRRVLAERQLGGLRFVSCLYNVPLRQMNARQFGHWMFEKPVNILLEQAVHPLSQVVVLAGPVEETLSIAGLPIDTFPGVPFHSILLAYGALCPVFRQKYGWR